MSLRNSRVIMDSLSGQQLLRKDETVVEADSILSEKKVLAFYFSAHWCPPCRLFTPVLAEFYSVTIIIMFLEKYKTTKTLVTGPGGGRGGV